MSSNNTQSTFNPDVANQSTAEDWMLSLDTANKKTARNSQRQLDIQQQAELQLTHALLQTIYEDKTQASQQHDIRMTRLLRAIATTKTPLRNKIAPLPAWFGLAASICLLAFTLSFWLTPSNHAIAEVHKLSDGLALLRDRVYQVSVAPVAAQQKANNSNQRPKVLLFDNKSADEPTDSSRTSAASWLNGANLYIRGANQYVLKANTHKGALLRGRNENASWKIGQDNAVKLYQDYTKIKLPFAGDAVALAFVNLPDMLEKLTKNYQLTHQASAAPNGSTEQRLSVITAVKKSSDMKGVKQITLFYQSNNHLIERIEFDRVHIQGNPERYLIHLQLTDTLSLDVNFFNPDYHLDKLDGDNAG